MVFRLPWLNRSRKGLTEEHLESMLRYAQDTGDVETSGIVDAMTRMLECRGRRWGDAEFFDGI